MLPLAPLKPSLFLFLALLLLPGCYYWQAGQGQVQVMFNTLPLAQAIDQEKDPQKKALLLEVAQIKQFGEQTLGLKPSPNYQSYYFTPLQGVTFVVTAAYADRLERYEWSYPIVGKLPYRGYFDLKEAKEYAKGLEKVGLDVWIFPATAYSTLGWMNDPITSPMLQQGRYGLAETLLHEMTHHSYFIEGQGAFNEQLASFVGQVGAKADLTQAQGQEELIKQAAHQVQAKQFKEGLKKLRFELETLFAKKLPLKATLKQKEAIYQNFADQSPAQSKFNNARLLLFDLYEEDNPLFTQVWADTKGEWPIFWEKVMLLGQKL